LNYKNNKYRTFILNTSFSAEMIAQMTDDRRDFMSRFRLLNWNERSKRIKSNC